MGTTTSYGTWANHARALTVEDTVSDFVNGGGAYWVIRLHNTGAFARIAADLRAAINDLLPDGVALHGDEFYGPANPTVDQADGIRDEIGDAIEAVDLGAIVQRHDPDAQTGSDNG